MMIRIFSLITLSVLLLAKYSEAAPASPKPAIYEQPDGSSTPELFLNGDEKYNWLSDSEGYTVIQDTNGWYVYAKKTADGMLESAGARVGRANPMKLGLEPYLIQDIDIRDDEDEQDALRLRRRNLNAADKMLCKQEASVMNPCYMKQLALLVRFKGHENRKLPPSEEIHILFNHNGPTGNSTAPTGSISDVYRANSFDTMVMDTHVTPWIQISKTEAYASGGKNGFNLDVTRECWAEALEKYAQTLPKDGIKQFDSDNDGYIDGMAIVHSGVAAESNGPDCETNAATADRIWSHAVPKASNFEFLSEFKKDLSGIKVGRFYVFSGIYDLCPPKGAGTQWDAGRIAVGAHEGGHFLGLTDLYGSPGKDNGIGNWGFMGNMYGWDASQNYPGNMGAYSRHLLGWVDVVDVTYSQTIVVTASCDSDTIYRISNRMASDNAGDEYFLIENRHACGHDVKLLYDGVDRQGIALWYVDHTMLLGKNAGKDVIGYNTNKPPDDSAWPKVHNRVSFVQGDGLFEMEKNKNRGNEYDTFRKDSGAGKKFRAYKITNDGVTMNDGSTKKYPNTKSIAYGDERPTGIEIEVLDEPSHDMSVKITLYDDAGKVISTAPASSSTTSSKNSVVGLVQQDGAASGEGGASSSTNAGDSSSSVASGDTSTGSSGSTVVGDSSGSKAVSDTTAGSSSAAAASTTQTSAPAADTSSSTTAASGSYTCDTKDDDSFKVSDDSGVKVRQCGFIDGEKRAQADWCNKQDLFLKQPVYMTCQIECHDITRCPGPKRYLRR